MRKIPFAEAFLDDLATLVDFDMGEAAIMISRPTTTLNFKKIDIALFFSSGYIQTHPQIPLHRH
jgi:hypothetical protein